MSPSAKFLLLFLFLFFYESWTSHAQFEVWARLDGFPYKNRQVSTDTVIIEAFFDPLCPICRDSWPPLKRILQRYGPSVSLIVHPFPLPYNDNAFVTSRALHIVNKLNSLNTYDLLELFFKHQDEFDNSATFNVSRAEIVTRIVKLATTVIGDSYYAALVAGFTNNLTNLATRVSFKYGSSKGVWGTPFFTVNGFMVENGGSAISYDTWISIIDPLVKARALNPNQEK